MPRRTSAKIRFGLEDVSAKEDSALSVSDELEGADVEQIEQTDLLFEPYATCELNYWMLDGTRNMIPDQGGEMGWWSAEPSDDEGVFASPPVLTVTFAEQHSSIGLTFTFYHTEWPTEINVKWYQGDALLAERNVSPDGAVYAVEEAVSNYTRIVAAFHRTNHPRRYLKVTGIQYGITQLFDGRTLMTASIREELDPVSEQLSINTLNFKLHSSSAAFSILNPTGIYAYLQQNQELTVSESVNGETRPMGTFYLDEWRGENENTFTMRAVDAVGIMSGTQYMGGIYDDAPAAEVIADIMGSAGAKYELAPELAGKKLSGWLPVLSHREALQQAAFALCAAVDTSRSDTVRIYRVDGRPRAAIERRRKFAGSTVELRQFVTGVEVTEHHYTKAATAGTTTLYEGVLPPGRSTVTFSSPAYDLAVTGAVLEAGHTNYATIYVEEERTVTVTGKNYADTLRVVGKYMQGLPAGEKQNVLIVDKATLISRSNSMEVAEHLYAYHQKRIQQDFTLLQDAEEVGRAYSVGTLYGQTKDGVMESAEIDLTGGFVGKVSIVGG